jgi:hypothetical protein
LLYVLDEVVWRDAGDRRRARADSGAFSVSAAPHIAAERRLVLGVLGLCLAAGLAIGAAAGDLFGAGVLWCWLGVFVLVGSAAARGMGAGQ